MKFRGQTHWEPCLANTEHYPGKDRLPRLPRLEHAQEELYILKGELSSETGDVILWQWEASIGPGTQPGWWELYS